jgi:hypothetical protein
MQSVQSEAGSGLVFVGSHVNGLKVDMTVLESIKGPRVSIGPCIWYSERYLLGQKANPCAKKNFNPHSLMAS